MSRAQQVAPRSTVLKLSHAVVRGRTDRSQLDRSPISQSLHSHRAEAIELLNFDMVGSRCFFGDIRSSSHLLSTLLSHSPGLQCLLIGIDLRLASDVNLFLFR